MTGVSNSFDYTPVKVLEGFVLDPSACSARTLGLHRARSSRVVLVERRGRIVLCRTRTTDFEESEIRTVVHDLGQLYLDVSMDPQVMDFANDLRQLVIAGECRNCRDFGACVLAYREAQRPFFAEDEAWLRERLRGLQGRVLDVGIGRGPYLEAMLDGLGSNALVLHGLDPEPGVNEVPGVSVFRTTIEHFRPPESEPYDHVIAIRSLHHISDLEKAFGAMVTLTRPGGTLLLMESVALPLVRSVRKSAYSHAHATGGFQHLRNWDSHRMLSFLEGRYPLRTLFHRPISPDTCDQWILVLERLAGQVQMT